MHRVKKIALKRHEAWENWLRHLYDWYSTEETNKKAKRNGIKHITILNMRQNWLDTKNYLSNTNWATKMIKVDLKH
jgi:hypothetical protein